MPEDRKISIAIPNWNRTDMLLEAFEKVYSDERISEIIISDDHSDRLVYYELESLFKLMPKVKMFRNDVNLDCYRNKHQAVELATNKWVILFDSDNIISIEYLDKIFSIPDWNENVIYAPDFAFPQFNYTEFSGLTVTKENVSRYIDRPMFMTCMNTFNFFINRENYLKVWDGSIDPVTSDSEFFNFCWLKSGRKIHITEGLQYFHRVHPDSHYQKNTHRTGNLPNEIKKQLMELT